MLVSYQYHGRSGGSAKQMAVHMQCDEWFDSDENRTLIGVYAPKRSWQAKRHTTEINIQ